MHGGVYAALPTHAHERHAAGPAGHRPGPVHAVMAGPGCGTVRLQAFGRLGRCRPNCLCAATCLRAAPKWQAKANELAGAGTVSRTCQQASEGFGSRARRRATIFASLERASQETDSALVRATQRPKRELCGCRHQGRARVACWEGTCKGREGEEGGLCICVLDRSSAQAAGKRAVRARWTAIWPSCSRP